MATVKLNVSERPGDASIEVPGLGAFKNKTTTELNEAQWERYKRYRGEGNYPKDGNLVIDTDQQREMSRKQREKDSDEKKTTDSTPSSPTPPTTSTSPTTPTTKKEGEV